MRVIERLKGENMKKIVVIGSINMDLVTVCERAPEGGETLFGTEFFQVPGGKGANQAVTMGKMGCDVTMLGMVGNDIFGKELLSSMKDSGVNVDFVEKTDCSTGIAKIIVEKNGQNRILVVPGANGCVDREYIDRHMDIIKGCDIVVAQLEIPVDTVEYAFEKAKELGKITILNPAPGRELSAKIIKNSDIIVPNESELGLITGMATDKEEEILKAGKKLMDMEVKSLIVTLGSKGSLYLDNKKVKFCPAYRVNAVDTTAAGDSFIGGLVTKMDKDCDDSIIDAISFATKVSAIAVTRKGAQTSIPTLEEVENFVGELKEEVWER